MKKLNLFVRFWLVGILYSCLFPILGGWFSLFVPQLSLFHSLVLGFLFGLFGFISSTVSERRWLFYGVGFGLISIHFVVWSYYYSRLLVLNNILTVTIIVGLLLLFLGISYLIVSLRSNPSISGGLFLLSFLILLVKWFVLLQVPVSYLGYHTNSQPGSIQFETSDLLYPLSVPIDEGLQRFHFLVDVNRPKKSIVFVVLDALRKDSIGKVVGGTKVTPNIDEISSDGILLDRYYVQSSWTKASTATLFTGEYPHQHGICRNVTGYEQIFPTSYRTVAEELNSAGYDTLGSAVIPHLASKYKFDQGFDLWLSSDSHFQSDYTSQEQILYEITRSEPEKLFVYLHMKGPHTPYTQALVNKKFWQGTPYYQNNRLVFENWNLPSPSTFTRKKFQRFRDENPDFTLTNEQIRTLRYLYNAQLNYFDRQYVGRFIRGLKAIDYYDKSMLFVTGDHGEDLFDVGFNFPGYKSEETPRRFGHVFHLRELVINPPLVIKTPADNSFSSPNVPKNTLIESMDLTQTILDYSDLTVPSVEGTSFLGGLKGQDIDRSKFQYALSEQCQVLDDEHTIVSDEDKIGSMTRKELKDRLHIVQSALVSDRWKIMKEWLSNTTFAYDLLNDPLEREPIQDFQNVHSELSNRLHTIMEGDTSIRKLPGKFIPATKKERRKLKGLGYLN